MADSGADVLPYLIPAGALAFAVYQYRINSLSADRQRRRERGAKVADELEAFHSDADVALALKVVDWGNLQVTFAETAWRPAFTDVVTTKTLREALELHWVRAKRLNIQFNDPEKSEYFTTIERALRDIVDSLLTRLERMNGLIDAGVVSRDEFFELFSYWLRLLAERPSPEQDMKLRHFGDRRRRALWEYIRGYEFNGVIRLFQKYGRAGEVGVAAKDVFVPKY
jgi:hypothetical protein